MLTTLQAPVRADLQTFLVEFGNGLDKFGGGEGLRTAAESSPDAFRYTAEVNEATLGTQPGDLTGLIVNLDSLVKVLDDNKIQLQDLIGNLGTVLGAFGKEDQALEVAVSTLPQVLSEGKPALAELNGALPQLRAFSREALPGTRSANPALAAANPFIRQLRKLVQPSELRGLTADLVPVVPSAANLTRQSLPFLEQARLVSSCFNNVIIPWGNLTPPNTDGTPSAPVFKSTGYALAGIGGESHSGDANGQWVRTGLTTGPNIVAYPPLPGEVDNVGIVGDLLGAEPTITSSAKTPFNPDAPCENQEPPNLASNNLNLQTLPGFLTPLGGARGGSAMSALPDNLQSFLSEAGSLITAQAAAKQKGGAEGAAAQAQAAQDIAAFSQDPKTRDALKELPQP